MYVDRDQEYDRLWNREAERLTYVERYLDWCREISFKVRTRRAKEGVKVEML
jgi:hypothetical protein